MYRTTNKFNDYKDRSIMKKIFALIMGSLALLASCSSSDSDIIEEEENNVPAASSQTITIPTEQVAGSSVFDGEANAVQLSQAVGGIKLNFQLSGITRIELESVDGYALAGNATVDLTGSEPAITAVTDSQSIITLEAPEGQTLTPGKDYYITTLPCNVYGGYRLSIYKDGLKADYYGVHQVITAGSYISPLTSSRASWTLRIPTHLSWRMSVRSSMPRRRLVS